MSKTIKKFNGRGYCCRKHDDKRWDAVPGNRSVAAYIGAASRADARRVIEEYCGHMPPDSELRDYWSEGCWGNSMDGIELERGLWLQFDPSKPPVKVV